MISCKKGDIEIEGMTFDIMADLSAIIHCVRTMLSKEYRDETAGEMIAFCGKLAFMSDEEVHEETEKIKRKYMGRN